jgi:hypothetical protein
MTADDTEQALRLIELALEQTRRLVRELTPEQVNDLIEGRAHLTLINVEPERIEKPAGCTCPCDHDGGCLTCGCRCEPTDPAGNVCPCCKADDGDLITVGGAA